MSRRKAEVLLFPEIVDVKIEEDNAPDPLSEFDKEQSDNDCPSTHNCRKKKVLSEDITPTLLKVIKCSLDLEIYKEFDLYKLKCSSCTVYLPLNDWNSFVKHFEDLHQELIQSVKKESLNIIVNDEVQPEEIVDNASIQNEMYSSESNYWNDNADDTDNAPESLKNDNQKITEKKKKEKKKKKTSIFQTDFDSNEESYEDSGDTDFVPESDDDFKQRKSKTDKKRKKKKLDDDEYLEKHFDPIRKDLNLIAINKTDKEIVLGFLEALKSHSLLWYKRQEIPQRYDIILSEMTESFNAKFSQYKMSSNDVRISVNRMKKLYEYAIDPRRTQKETDLAFRINFPEYFDLCSEINDESENLKRKCEYCDCAFINEIELQVHKFQMHSIGELPFKCNRCGRCFIEEKTLHKHMKKEHSEKPYPCNLCKKAFDKEQKLQKHLAHHERAKQICQVCGKVFLSNEHYRGHIIYHAPPTFKCDICGKMLYRKTTLSEHMKTHTNLRNYVCEVCGAAFNINNGLQIHRRQVHKIKTQVVWAKKATASKNNTRKFEGERPTTSTNPPLTHGVFHDPPFNDVLGFQQQQGH